MQGGWIVGARIACDYAQRMGLEVSFNHKLVQLKQRSENVITDSETPKGSPIFDPALETVREWF